MSQLNKGDVIQFHTLPKTLYFRLSLHTDYIVYDRNVTGNIFDYFIRDDDKKPLYVNHGGINNVKINTLIENTYNIINTTNPLSGLTGGSSSIPNRVGYFSITNTWTGGPTYYQNERLENLYSGKSDNCPVCHSEPEERYLLTSSFKYCVKCKDDVESLRKKLG